MTIKCLLVVVTLFVFSTLGGCSRLGGVDNPVAPSGVTPKVYMDPATKSVTVGSTFSLNVYIENVANLFYANIYIKYDPAKLSYASSAMGDFLKQGVDSSNVTFASVDLGNGILNLSPSRKGKSNGGVSGSGVLYTVTFKAVSSTAGSGTTISFIDENGYSLGFRDPNDNEIQRTIGNGTIVNIP